MIHFLKSGKYTKYIKVLVMNYNKEIEKEFRQDLLHFCNTVLQHYGNNYKLNLYYIKYLKNGETLRQYITTFKVKNFKYILYKYNIIYKNIKKMENIYFSPYNFETKSNIIWLDDININKLTEKQKEYITLIETSPNNYQGYIKLDKMITKETYKKIVAYFINKFSVDKSSNDFIHLRRFPGVYSWKHYYTKGIIHYIKQINTSKILETKKLIKKIENITHPPQNTDKSVFFTNTDKSVFLNINYNKLYNTLYAILNNNFKVMDYNIVDFRFSLILYYYFNIKDIEMLKDILQKCSINIQQRKQGHVDDYIERTINKVVTNKGIEIYYNKVLKYNIPILQKILQNNT